MDTLWILIANGSSARLYATDAHHRAYELIDQFLHPISRQKEQVMTSDHASHRETRTEGSASQAVYGSYPEPTDPKDYEIERFARELAEHLNIERTRNRFAGLMLVAPPRFHGMLNRHLDEQVRRLVSRHIDKDYTGVPDHALAATLAPHFGS